MAKHDKKVREHVIGLAHKYFDDLFGFDKGERSFSDYRPDISDDVPDDEIIAELLEEYSTLHARHIDGEGRRISE
jgi:hypothetical protein